MLKPSLRRWPVLDTKPSFQVILGRLLKYDACRISLRIPHSNGSSWDVSAPDIPGVASTYYAGQVLTGHAIYGFAS